MLKVHLNLDHESTKINIFSFVFSPFRAFVIIFIFSDIQRHLSLSFDAVKQNLAQMIGNFFREHFSFENDAGKADVFDAA